MTDKYIIIYSDEALNDIDSIFNYISNKLQNFVSAVRIFYLIKDKINSLNSFPERFQLATVNGKQIDNLRIMHVGKYNVYYCVNNSKLIVTVMRIIYGGADITKIAID